MKVKRATRKRKPSCQNCRDWELNCHNWERLGIKEQIARKTAENELVELRAIMDRTLGPWKLRAEQSDADKRILLQTNLELQEQVKYQSARADSHYDKYDREWAEHSKSCLMLDALCRALYLAEKELAFRTLQKDEAVRRNEKQSQTIIGLENSNRQLDADCVAMRKIRDEVQVENNQMRTDFCRVIGEMHGYKENAKRLQVQLFQKRQRWIVRAWHWFYGEPTPKESFK